MFLINNDITGYKLTQNLSDLTYAQIHFLYLCAKKQQEIIDAALNSNKSNSATANPLKIVGNENPDVIKEKLLMMKSQMRGS